MDWKETTGVGWKLEKTARKTFQIPTFHLLTYVFDGTQSRLLPVV